MKIEQIKAGDYDWVERIGDEPLYGLYIRSEYSTEEALTLPQLVELRSLIDTFLFSELLKSRVGA